MKKIFFLLILTMLLTIQTGAEELPSSVYIPNYSKEWVDNFSIDPLLLEFERYTVENAIITAYCPCPKCCGKWSAEYHGGVAKTASGTIAQAGRTVGCDPKLIPYGTHIWIDGHEYVVEDTGSGLTKGRLHIDVYHNSHSDASDFGLQYKEVSWVS